MPMLIVVAGPSGCGKTSIARELLRRHAGFVFSVSATTRPRRPQEVHGKDYYFLSKAEFERQIAAGELAEWELIYGDYYGTPKQEIERAIGAGRSLLLDLDVKGALSIKRLYGPRAVSIFIRPPDLQTLAERLQRRKTESAAALARRLERVTMELGMAEHFDYTVVNDVLSRAVEEVDDIIRNHRPEITT